MEKAIKQAKDTALHNVNKYFEDNAKLIKQMEKNGYKNYVKTLTFNSFVGIIVNEVFEDKWEYDMILKTIIRVSGYYGNSKIIENMINENYNFIKPLRTLLKGVKTFNPPEENVVDRLSNELIEIMREFKNGGSSK